MLLDRAEGRPERLSRLHRPGDGEDPHARRRDRLRQRHAARDWRCSAQETVRAGAGRPRAWTTRLHQGARRHPARRRRRRDRQAAGRQQARRPDRARPPARPGASTSVLGDHDVRRGRDIPGRRRRLSAPDRAHGLCEGAAGRPLVHRPARGRRRRSCAAAAAFEAATHARHERPPSSPGSRRAPPMRRCSRPSAAAKPMIRVGIGGWTFEPWRGVFYPDEPAAGEGAGIRQPRRDRDRGQRHLLFGLQAARPSPSGATRRPTASSSPSRPGASAPTARCWPRRASRSASSWARGSSSSATSSARSCGSSWPPRSSTPRISAAS